MEWRCFFPFWFGCDLPKRTDHIGVYSRQSWQSLLSPSEDVVIIADFPAMTATTSREVGPHYHLTLPIYLHATMRAYLLIPVDLAVATTAGEKLPFR